MATATLQRGHSRQVKSMTPVVRDVREMLLEMTYRLHCTKVILRLPILLDSEEFLSCESMNETVSSNRAESSWDTHTLTRGKPR